MSHAFIIHAKDDSDHLLRLHEALRQASIPDLHVSIDADPESFKDLEALDQAFALIVPISRASQTSSRVREAIDAAVSKGVQLFPVRMDGARLNTFFKKEIGPLLKHDATTDGGLAMFVGAVRERYKRRCPVVAVMNLKGGVGKTTVAAQIFGTLQAERRNRVLLIDFDPQYNLTQHFFTMADADAFAAADQSVISLFERSKLHYPDATSPAESWTTIETAPFEPAPRKSIARRLLPPSVPGWLDLVTGQFEISKYAFAANPADLERIRENFLRCIDRFRANYDLIIFDTNPNATFLTTCALIAADRIIAPMHADEFSLRGIRLLNSLIQNQVAEADRPELDVLFNAVERNEQSEFEADARIGVYDGRVGFPLAKRLMISALPRSNFFRVQAAPDGETAPHNRLLIHYGRGGSLKQAREKLREVALEVNVLTQPPIAKQVQEVVADQD